jgi:cytoskeletal protein RodZ
MKSILLCLTMVLSASLSAATSEATQTILPDQQICVKANTNTPVNEVKSLTEEERIEAHNAENDNPKPEKKRHLFAKIVGGIVIAFGLVVTIFILDYTARQH